MKKGVREDLMELLLDLQEEQEDAEGDHNGGNSDMVYYAAGAKLEILKKVMPVLRKAVKDLK